MDHYMRQIVLRKLHSCADVHTDSTTNYLQTADGGEELYLHILHGLC